LWLRQRSAPPRAYETTLNEKLKRALRDAQTRLGRGERVMLVKARLEAERTANKQCAQDDLGYQLDDSFFSPPPKS
jgi:hypothetical protein